MRQLILLALVALAACSQPAVPQAPTATAAIPPPHVTGSAAETLRLQQQIAASAEEYRGTCEARLNPNADYNNQSEEDQAAILNRCMISEAAYAGGESTIRAHCASMVATNIDQETRNSAIDFCVDIAFDGE